VEPGPVAAAERAAALVDRVVATRAAFTKADVWRAAFHEPDSRAIARLALDGDETVIVGKDARGVTRYDSTDYLRDEARPFHAASEPPAASSATIRKTSSAPSTARSNSRRSSAAPFSPPLRPDPQRRPRRRRQDDRCGDHRLGLPRRRPLGR
jgi:hypothetical protein